MTVEVPASYIAQPETAIVGLRDYNTLTLTIAIRPSMMTTMALRFSPAFTFIPWQTFVVRDAN